MPFDFRVEILENSSGRTHKRVRALCDGCQEEKTVRRSFASKKIRETGTNEYYCVTCSSKKNIEKARRVKMDNELLNEFTELCETIYLNLYDDKSEVFISQKTGNTSLGLIRMARDFVYQYLNTGFNDNIYDCAEHIGLGADQELLDLYPWEVEMKARAMIHLENQPHPEGL